jgi:transposase InsO family protein
MPSWIKEKDGIEWYDEPYTVKETNQSPEQLAKKVKAGAIRRFKQRNGGYWYARPDVEALREAYLKRSTATKGRKVSNAAIEARFSRQWERQMEKEKAARRTAEASLGPGYAGGIARHQERVMLHEIEQANAARKKAAQGKGEDSD